MNFIINNKNKLILGLLILAYLLFYFRFHFYFNPTMLLILIKTNKVLSYLILILLLISFVKASLPKEIILGALYIIILESIFLLANGLTYHFIFWLSVLMIVILLSLLILLLPSKIKTIFIYLIFIFWPLYLISQHIYITIFNDFFSINEIGTLKEGLAFATGVVHFKIIYLVYLIILILSLIIYSKIKTQPRFKFSYQVLLIPLIIYLLIQFNAQYPVKEARMHTSDHYLYKSIYNNKRFVSRFGIVNYFFRDLARIIIPKSKPTSKYIKEIDQFLKTNHKPHHLNDYSGLFEDKNLIFIIAESFDFIAINDSLTPTLYQLMNEGLTFTNFYVPVYPRTTCDSEIIFNTGLIPSIIDGPTCYTFNLNTYHHSLANLFKTKGYQVNAFHSNDKLFYTRNLVYQGLGYDKFYGQHELGLTDEDKRFDSYFFEHAKDYIVKEDNKFMSVVLTLSGHSPYLMTNLAVIKYHQLVADYFKDQKIKVPEDIIFYLAAQIEVDKLVSAIIDDLTTKKILDDTVLILIADHYPYTIKKATYEKYTGIKDNYLKNRSPFIIWSNQIKPEMITTLGSSFDMLPTIANLFNLPVNYNLYFGDDIFSDNHQSLVYFKDYSWFDGNNYVLFDKHLKGDGDLSYIKETNEKVNLYFDISRKILLTDYFNNHQK